MAQKAAKHLATQNTRALNRMHLISLTSHLLFLLLRLLIFRSANTTRTTLLRYILLTLPSLFIQFYLEKLGRPSYTPNGELSRPGEDMDAKGLTEFMWDVLYWTWACMAAAALFGDRAWWGWVAVPGYGVYLVVRMVGGVREGMGMGGIMGKEGEGERPGESKRQKKMERRGGQRVQYR